MDLKKEEVSKIKKGKIAIWVGLGLLILLYGLFQGFMSYKEMKIDEIKALNCDNVSIQEPEKKSDVYEYGKALSDSFFESEKYSYGIKFLIFLGVVYLLQSAFFIVTDIIEVFLLVFVAMFRTGKWIKRKITGGEKK